MKKIKNIIFICLISLFINISGIKAFSINASSSVYVNKTIAVTIEANGLIGRFDITSSNQSVLAGSDSKWIENGSVTVYFTAVKEGTATITVNAVDVSDESGNDFTGSRSININVVKKSNSPSINVNPNYSKNNYLESLSVEGYELEPTFDKDTLEYKVKLSPGTEKININAKTIDNSASVKGIGEIEVTEGINTLNIVVTAENGNERTYIIVATVEEKDPIDIKINSKKYRVIKKKELIGTKDGYIDTTIKINDIDVPALYNEVTKITLIGLKDEEGNIKFFSYDTKTGKYQEYQEFSFNLMNLYIKEKKNSKYEKITIKINDINVPAYKIAGISDYYLLYATNTITGNESYYLYDIKENSVQRYNTTMLETITKEKDKYFALVIVLSCVCFLTMLFLLIEVNKYNKKLND